MAPYSAVVGGTKEIGRDGKNVTENSYASAKPRLNDFDLGFFVLFRENVKKSL